MKTARHSRSKAPDASVRIRGLRPRRGSPEETRERLIAAAAKLFNTVGYHGTDSNRIAATAGYSPGTFYKHFNDKCAIFLAVYESWLAAEWNAIESEMSQERTIEETARRLVLLTVDFHRRWRGFRSSLLGLLQENAAVKRFYLKQRRRQLDLLVHLRSRFGRPKHEREEDAVRLFAMERSSDAIAHGDIRRLGLNQTAFIDFLTDQVTRALG